MLRKLTSGAAAVLAVLLLTAIPFGPARAQHEVGAASPDTTKPWTPPSLPPPPPSEILFVESWPVETTLEHKYMPKAADVWIELMNQATRTLDFAEFYAVSDSNSIRMKTVLSAMKAAADRGVPIRFLCEEKFYKTYPELVDQIALWPNAQVRRLDSQAFDGGVLHCKYFIVNGQKTYLGSQNFDWRSLEHIQELGVYIDNAEFSGAMTDIFDLDWTIAGMVKPGTVPAGGAKALVDSLVAARVKTGRVGSLPLKMGWGVVWARPVMSPTGRILNERYWDEPRLQELIDGARDSVDIQLLTYNDMMKDGSRYEAFRKPLRDAAKRGVKIRLLVADWCKKAPTIESLKELSKTKNIEIRFMDIPQAKSGFIPFARVCHAKYMVVDGKKFWVGTGNWESDYFHKSRNVGIIGESPDAGRQLANFFDGNWTSTYAEVLDAKKTYEAPRVAQ